MYKIVIMVKKVKMYDSNEVFNLEEKLKKDKTVKQKDVFQTDPSKKKKKKNSKKIPKGYHRMPNGKLMKDSDMPKKY